MIEELKEAIAVLEAAQEKLKLYRMVHSGEYIGGVEYTNLQERISDSIFNLTVYAAKQEDDGRALPVLPEGWNIRTLFNRENDEVWGVVINFYKPGDWICADAKSGEGPTPRAAVLAAIAQIPKQDEKER